MLLIFALILALVILSMIAYAVNRDVGFVAMQVSLGLFIVFGTYWLSLLLLKRDQLLVASSNKRVGSVKTMIIDGYAESFNLTNTVYDTLNAASISFAYLPRSVNRYGGAQFTYQFWILMTNVSPDNIGSKDILIRGDTTTYNLMKVDNKTKQTIARMEDVVIKCPRIRFDGRYDEMVIEINTVADPLPAPFRITATPGDLGDDDAEAQARFNVMRLVPNKWALYTFTFRDDIDINDFERGIEMRFYINELLYQRSTMPSAIRQNNGNLFLFPTGAVQGCKLGNLAYYNYAVSEQDVARTTAQGPPKSANTVSSSPTAMPLFLTEYNKLDTYTR
jgi:hypothetical protein